MFRYPVLFLLCLLAHLPAAYAIDIKISDSRSHNFYLDALRWVLDKSGQPYRIHYTEHPASSQQRKVLLVKNGDIDLLYAGTSKTLEETLLPIRFPIMRGLSGRRIFLINKHHQDLYNGVHTVNDLRQQVGVQGIGWSDTQVLTAAGLTQSEKPYDDIFVNLNAGSRMYFPRGMTEIFSELAAKQAKLPNIAIEQNILLEYKTAVFFFVHRDNSALAEMLHRGFKTAYQDGSYLDFFYSHARIKNAFEQAQIEQRVRIKLDNPFLTKATLAIPQQYWHQD